MQSKQCGEMETENGIAARAEEKEMKVCTMCGAELTKWQRLYCAGCAYKANLIKSRERGRRIAEEELRNGVKQMKKKDMWRESEHFEWEADICLNCKKGRCTNCLITKSVAEKKVLLEKSGGKKWLD